MKFDARIDGSAILCSLTPDRDIANPIFCYSIMAPSVSCDGFERIKSVGGYTELQLPDLTEGKAFEFKVAYENPEFAPANRAWLPLGSYLRSGDTIINLPVIQPAGVVRGSITYPSGEASDLLICPQPLSFTSSDGSLQVSGIRSNSPDLQRVADLTNRTGLGPFLSDDGLQIACEQDHTLPAESYRLEIAATGISLAHADSAGAFYGGVTLAMLIANPKGNIPYGTIYDAPRFEWRGQHLDCARHFYGVDTILRLLDLMALLKMNRFHWHFADDEAFRLELDSLPELSQTHYRGEGEILPGVFGGGSRSGGSYSKADTARIIAHAKSLNIEVMPEIETPAHALTLCKLFPETRDRMENGAEQSVQGYLQNVMNPAMPESWRVWEAMISEVSEMFPFEMLHLGGDELPHETWQGSPAAKQLMGKKGLQTTEDIFGWTMNKLAQFTVSKGKIPGGWEESARGVRSIGNDAVIFSWTGQGPGLQAARDGHRVVMMPGQKAYLDMAQTDDKNDWGANWAAIIPLEETLNWDPVPDAEPDLEANIIGVEGAFWSEFTTLDHEMEPMIAPRILGIAMMARQSKGSATPDILFVLRKTYESILDAIGWQQS